MILYHGSQYNLEEGDFLEPRVSYEGKARVYLTDKFTYALVRAGSFNNSLQVREDYDGNCFSLCELKPDAFMELFDHKGYIYIVETENYQRDDNSLPNEFYVEKPIMIRKKLIVNNIWDWMTDVYPSFYKLFYYGDDNTEYWSHVTGGKEGYLQRRTEAIQKLQNDKKGY